MTTKKIIEQDICATCVNVCLLEPPPPTGQWEKKALCTAGWPYTRVFASANAIDECPQYERVMQPSRPWPFPPESSMKHNSTLGVTASLHQTVPQEGADGAREVQRG